MLRFCLTTPTDAVGVVEVDATAGSESGATLATKAGSEPAVLIALSIVVVLTGLGLTVVVVVVLVVVVVVELVFPT